MMTLNEAIEVTEELIKDDARGWDWLICNNKEGMES